MSGVEYLEDGKWILTDESDEKYPKIFSLRDNLDRVTDGRCKAILKIGAFEIIGSEMEVCTISDVTSSGVDIIS